VATCYLRALPAATWAFATLSVGVKRGIPGLCRTVQTSPAVWELKRCQVRQKAKTGGLLPSLAIFAGVFSKSAGTSIAVRYRARR
jgi:hypothetical protein